MAFWWDKICGFDIEVRLLADGGNTRTVEGLLLSNYVIPAKSNRRGDMTLISTIKIQGKSGKLYDFDVWPLDSPRDK